MGNWISVLHKRRGIGFALIGLILAASAGYVFGMGGEQSSRVTTLGAFTAKSTRVIVVDAGHGGEDGGAVSPGGYPESEYNLEIALRTELFLRFLGMPTVMTRTEDISLHDDSARTIRQKKISDLKNRAALVSGLDGAVLLSIHQNSFTDARYSGAQVFCNKKPESQDLAKTMQDALREGLNPDNRREPKFVDVYLMNEARCPAVLVECGFLSNAAEEVLLREPKYQTKLSMIMSTTLTKWVIAAENQTID